MALRRSARGGTTINLRARMLDDLGDDVQASGVQIYLFDSSQEPDEEGQYDTLSAIHTGLPSCWEDGIFEYQYDVPENGPDGIWHDVWQGMINGQQLEESFSFEVSASGAINSLPGQFNNNNIVEVIVPSGIQAIDGSELGSEYSFTFMTTIVPAYTSPGKVMLEAGGAFPNATDEMLYVAILEASIEAEMLTFAKSNLNSSFYKHARREWATCRAAAALATNIRSMTNVKSKKLGDFSVQYDTDAANDLMDRVSACLDRWEKQLNSGGYATQTPGGVIKGETDPDRPKTGRMWRSTDEGNVTRRIPVANSKTRESGSRRWEKGYKGRRW